VPSGKHRTTSLWSSHLIRYHPIWTFHQLAPCDSGPYTRGTRWGPWRGGWASSTSTNQRRSRRRSTRSSATARKTAGPGHSFPDCLLIVYQNTLAASCSLAWPVVPFSAHLYVGLPLKPLAVIPLDTMKIRRCLSVELKRGIVYWYTISRAAAMVYRCIMSKAASGSGAGPCPAAGWRRCTRCTPSPSTPGAHSRRAAATGWSMCGTGPTRSGKARGLLAHAVPLPLLRARISTTQTLLIQTWN